MKQEILEEVYKDLLKGCKIAQGFDLRYETTCVSNHIKKWKLIR